MQTRSDVCFASSPYVDFCFQRSVREEQIHSLLSHSLGGGYPRIECVQHL
jgi:hypothetical protein